MRNFGKKPIIAPVPKAILFDLDDTILAEGSPDECWQGICQTFAPMIEGLSSKGLFTAVVESRDWFWSDPERTREGRLDLVSARRAIVSSAFSRLGVGSRTVANEMADSYTVTREEELKPCPGAIETLLHLKNDGVRSALITNGAGESQRAKIDRFQLGPLFDLILIEGERGIGKPDERVYLHALEQLNALPSETWMVGDNLEWEVAAPQRLGIFGIWVDPTGKGLPESSAVRPDHIIRTLPELQHLYSSISR